MPFSSLYQLFFSFSPYIISSLFHCKHFSKSFDQKAWLLILPFHDVVVLVTFCGASYLGVVNSREDGVPVKADFLAALLPLLCIPAVVSLFIGLYKWSVSLVPFFLAYWMRSLFTIILYDVTLILQER